MNHKVSIRQTLNVGYNYSSYLNDVHSEQAGSVRIAVLNVQKILTQGSRDDHAELQKYDTIRYDTIDDLHWKTDRQAASFPMN